MNGNCSRKETAVNKPVYPWNKLNVFTFLLLLLLLLSFFFFFFFLLLLLLSSSIVTDVVSAVNLARSPALNYRQFRAFLDEIESISFNPSGSNQFRPAIGRFP